MKPLVALFLLLLFFGSDKKKEVQHFSLPKALNELSGLAFINDTTLVVYIDGGD
mgnify:CR=1 FL=1